MNPSQEAAILKAFGHTTLKPFQRTALNAILQGRDVFLSAPTSSGKTLVFEAPSVIRRKTDITIVVSPLNSLMNDQLKHLRKLEGSGVKGKIVTSIDDGVKKGKYQILFMSPEMLMQDAF